MPYFFVAFLILVLYNIVRYFRNEHTVAVLRRKITQDLTKYLGDMIETTVNTRTREAVLDIIKQVDGLDSKILEMENKKLLGHVGDNLHNLMVLYRKLTEDREWLAHFDSRRELSQARGDISRLKKMLENPSSDMIKTLVKAINEYQIEK